MHMNHTSKRSVTVYNRSSLGVALIIPGSSPYVVLHGDRIAQIVMAPVVQAGFDVVESLSDTARGTGGFGSTGRS